MTSVFNSKRFVAGLVATLLTLSLSIFTFGNALTLAASGDVDEALSSPLSTPLTSAVELCEEAKASFSDDIKNAHAFGLSLHLSKQQVKDNILAIIQAKKAVCKEAKNS